MKSSLIQKPVLSPFVAVGFVVIAVTGILLFFHVKNGSIIVLHEWFGWAFVVTGAVHLLLNFKVLLSYFKLRSSLVSGAVACVLAIVLAVIGLNHRGGPPDANRPTTEQR